jgi:hypothetical protein
MPMPILTLTHGIPVWFLVLSLFLPRVGFAVYRMDPHVVVFCPSAVGGCVVGFTSQGAGSDLYSWASGVRRVVLDTPGDGCRGMGWVWGFS